MNKRIKTIIVIDNMNVGGIATSLYNFLNFSYDLLDCDLLVFAPETVDISKLPKGVNLITPSKKLSVLGISQCDIRKKSIALAILRASLVAISKIVSGQFSRQILFGFSHKICGYDLAISFAHDNGWKSLSKGCNDFVIKKIVAPYKLSFIHCDYKNYGGYHKKQESMFSNMNAIACVSNSCMKSFKSVFPALSSKCVVCENFTNVDLINKMSFPAISYPNECINFVTVCRLSEEKGLDRAIEAFAELRKENYENFTWTIVGNGPEKNNLIGIVNAHRLNDKIFFVGDKKNPYPYMKNATMFLLPSFHEAAPMVFGESMALELPILTTDTCSAIELVQENNCGYVVENSKKGIMLGIKRILENPLLLENINIAQEKINEKAKLQLNELVNLINKYCNG